MRLLRMIGPETLCQATTKAGSPCRNPVFESQAWSADGEVLDRFDRQRATQMKCRVHVDRDFEPPAVTVV